MSIDPNKLLEQELLREHFAPQAPDPDRFREAVQRRIAGRPHVERNAAAPNAPARGAEPGAAAAEPGGRMRSAAGLLPPGLVSTTMLGASAGAKQVSVKLLPALVAWPALSLLALGSGAVLTVRAIRQTTSGAAPVADDIEASQAASRQWWRQHRVGVLLSILLLTALGWFVSAEGVVLLLAVSLLPLIGILRTYERQGLGSRVAVGSALSGLLMATGITVSCMHSFQQLRFGGPALPGGGFLYLILVIGSLLCSASTLRGLGRPTPEARSARDGLVALLALAPLIALPLLFLGRGSHAPGSRQDATTGSLTRISPEERLQAYAAGFDPASTWPSWMAYARAVERLRASGAAPDTEPAAAWLAGALARGDRLSPSVLDAAARLDVLRPEARNEIAASDRSQRLLRREGPFSHLHMQAFRIRVLADRLDPRTRATLAARLLATAPAPGDKDAVRTTALIAELLELLEADVRLDRSAVHAILEAAWTGPGFQGDPAAPPLLSSAIHQTEPTLHAVDLILRYGLPSAVPGGELMHFLRRSFSRPNTSSAHLAVAQDLLERRYPDLRAVAPASAAPGPSAGPARLLEPLIKWRAILGALLLVGLCLYATWRAPVGPPA